MKVVKLHEQTSEQFLNHTQNPKIAYYQRPKKSKTTPKLSQNQKTQLKETKSIKACVGAFRTLLFNSYLSPLQCVSLLLIIILQLIERKFETNLFFSIFGGVGGPFTMTDHLKLLMSFVRPSGNCSPTHIIQNPFNDMYIIFS